MRVHAAPSRRRARAVAWALAVGFCTCAAEAAPPKSTRPSSCTASDDSAAPPDADASADELHRRGVCAQADGHFIAALKLFQTALRRSPPAPLARRLKQRSDELVGKLASVRIEPGSLPDGATATVAAKKYELGTKRFVDPGKVEIEVSAPGYVTRTVTFELDPSEERLVTIVLSPNPTAPSATPATPPDPPSPVETPAVRQAPPPAEPAPASTSSWRPVGYVVLGVGGAALVAGGVTGYLALGQRDEVRRDCPTKTTCSASGDAAARSGSTYSTISTVATIGGGVLALGGLALVIWGGPKAAVRPSVGQMNGLVLSGEM